MSKMIIFDPAMCCSTGVCGPSIDTELLRVATILSNLEKRGIKVERYNLSGNPKAFVDNTKINELLKTKGIDALPAIIVDGEIVKTKAYPTNEEFAKYLGVPSEYIIAEKPKSKGCCCGPKGCC